MSEKDIISCALAEPYPEVSAGRNDPETALLLREDYAGARSELTALSAYMYQSVLLRKQDPDTAAVLENIALTEMKHAELLAGALLALDADPRYSADAIGAERWWSGADVGYGKLRRDMLTRDVTGELDAAARYRYHAGVTENAAVRALLLRIARDEDCHADVLSGLLSAESAAAEL